MARAASRGKLISATRLSRFPWLSKQLCQTQWQRRSERNKPLKLLAHPEYTEHSTVSAGLRRAILPPTTKTFRFRTRIQPRRQQPRFSLCTGGRALVLDVAMTEPLFSSLALSCSSSTTVHGVCTLLPRVRGHVVDNISPLFFLCAGMACTSPVTRRGEYLMARRFCITGALTDCTVAQVPQRNLAGVLLVGWDGLLALLHCRASPTEKSRRCSSCRLGWSAHRP